LLHQAKPKEWLKLKQAKSTVGKVKLPTILECLQLPKLVPKSLEAPITSEMLKWRVKSKN